MSRSFTCFFQIKWPQSQGQRSRSKVKVNCQRSRPFKTSKSVLFAFFMKIAEKNAKNWFSRSLPRSRSNFDFLLLFRWFLVKVNAINPFPNVFDKKMAKRRSPVQARNQSYVLSMKLYLEHISLKIIFSNLGIFLG